MPKLIDIFPILANALSNSLRSSERASLAEQIDVALVTKVTFDNSANAGYISVEPCRKLNVVEANIIGTRHGETIHVETKYWTNIDTDNFERIVGIEILNPGALKAELRRRTTAPKPDVDDCDL